MDLGFDCFSCKKRFSSVDELNNHILKDKCWEGSYMKENSIDVVSQEKGDPSHPKVLYNFFFKKSNS